MDEVPGVSRTLEYVRGKDGSRDDALIVTAFDVLGDAEKREMYDRYGSAFETMGAGGPQGTPWGGSYAGPGGFHAENFDFTQFFDERFGQEAIQAISRWRFSPAIKAGKPIPCWCFQKISFEFTR